MLGYAIRAILIFLGGILVSRNRISQETVDYFADNLVSHLVGIVLVVAAAVELYFKAKKDERINEETVKEAIKSEPGTPISVVKNRVLDLIRNKK